MAAIYALQCNWFLLLHGFYINLTNHVFYNSSESLLSSAVPLQLLLFDILNSALMFPLLKNCSIWNDGMNNP